MRRAYLLLLVTSAATAAASYRTTILVTPGSDEVAGAALVAALKTEFGTKLDACWTRAVDRSVKVELAAGRVTKVEPIGVFEPSEQECLLRTLKEGKVAAAKEPVAVTLELKSRPQIDRLNALKGTGGLVPGLGGGGLVMDGRAVATKPRVKELNVSIGPPAVEGELSADRIDRVLQTRSGMFLTCFVKELERQPGLEGTLAMTFTVAPDGSVVSPKRSSSTFEAVAVESCVSGLLMRLEFPATGKGATVGVPFRFTQYR